MLWREHQGHGTILVIKNKLEAFLLYIDEDMISEIVERTKEPMHKVCKKINADEFLQPAKELWYDTFSARSI